MGYPIVDLHCDLLSYLDTAAGSSIHDTEAIGCALPHLKAGGVKLQVMALFSLTEAGSAEAGLRQVAFYKAITKEGTGFRHLEKGTTWEMMMADDAVYTLAAIENASCFFEEKENLKEGFRRFEWMAKALGGPLYLTITHHAENRFGGGNFTSVGLKPDGKALLEFLDGRGVAVDLSHTCDLFAHELLEYIDRRGLDLRVLASHSNFRPVWDHVRNLPDDLTQAVRAKGGLVGLNLVRDFVNPEDAGAFAAHVRYGLAQGVPLAWAADYFSPLIMPPQFAFREPYFHPGHEDARCYPKVMDSLKDLGAEVLAGFAWKNAWDWIRANP